MKILFITDLYPVESAEKTTPRTLYNFVAGWRELGNEVTVLKPNFLFNSFLRKKPFYKTGWYKDIFNVNYFFPFVGNIKRKLSHLAVEEFEIVVAHMPSGILFADKLGTPFIAGVHNSDIEVLTNPIYRIYFKSRLLAALRNSKAIACRSFVLRDKLLKLYPEFKDKVFVAPSGIDEKYIINDFSHSIDKNNLKIVTCANFKKRKNIDKLVKACKGIDGVQLTVIGDGAGRKKLEKENKDAVFTGQLSNSQVLEVMKKSDLFILPSVMETFGMVYLEAMASGCITVCTQNDGIDGIIQNGINGFTTRADADEIRKLILNIKNTDIRVLEDIRKKSLITVKQYTQNGCSKNYLNTIHKKLFQ